MTTEHNDPEFLRLLFTDLLGRTRSVELGYDRLDDVIENGIVIDGSSVPGYSTVNESDALLLPTRATPLIQPWDSSVAFLLCHVHEVNGKPHPRDPRYILEKIVRRASERNLKLMVGSELEFFIISKREDSISPGDRGGYFSSQPLDSALDLRRDIIRSLNKVGIQTTTHHHEVANGQQEIGLQYMPAEIAADNIMLARLIISEMAYRRGLLATFMPKPFKSQNGSGMHLHQSVWKHDVPENLFVSKQSSMISPLALYYIGGLLAHAATLASILAPTVNSYKRLVPGFEAPTRVAWGYRNRSTMIRVPYFNGSATAARIELRCPDGSSSPHLVIAAMLAAGLDGIERKLEPPKPTEENLYESTSSIESLPASLHEAISYLAQSQIMRDALGDSAVDQLVVKREEEWNSYVKQTGNPGTGEVTEWEIDKYLLAN